MSDEPTRATFGPGPTWRFLTLSWFNVGDADLRLVFQDRKNNVTCFLFMIKKEGSSYMTAVYSWSVWERWEFWSSG